MVRPYLQKNSLREPICPEQRLTFRYLASGDQILSLVLAHRVGVSTAHKIIKETCEIIASVLMGVYMKTPSEDEWKDMSRDFLTNSDELDCCNGEGVVLGIGEVDCCNGEGVVFGIGEVGCCNEEGVDLNIDKVDCCDGKNAGICNSTSAVGYKQYLSNI
ncbi:hypothetical protein EAI_06327 [Harpegnathos saltator]|uniref:Nuclease HARBI1 n=1 Tax=Harpegnathos saltator TaxID=610380 RepID=E2BFA0_HARSA|nr:hypothetical protein EAI_06327 [Harpegnathos saltator]